MADTDDTSTTDTSTTDTTGQTPAEVIETPVVSEDSSVPADAQDTADAEDTADADEETADAGSDAESETADAEGETAEAAAVEPEPELPRFATAFSSPEPTAVVARPRRRATRAVIAADSDPVEAATPAPAVPAFVSFVAPSEADVPPAPRRRGRRAAAAVEPDAVDEAAPEDDGEADAPARPRRSRSRRRPAVVDVDDSAAGPDSIEPDEVEPEDADEAEDREEGGTGSRRRRAGAAGAAVAAPVRDSGDEDSAEESSDEESVDEVDDESAEVDADEAESTSSTRRRRRRRRRSGSGGGGDASSDDADDDDRPERAGRNGRLTSDDDVRGVAGSTRLEAKRQRRRDGRDTGRRRTPILTESEFLARREAVDRAMVIRQRGERTQIAVLEDDVLVEHYVTQASATSFAGNVYLGRVQNVLPSMEAAFVDIGKRPQRRALRRRGQLGLLRPLEGKADRSDRGRAEVRATPCSSR